MYREDLTGTREILWSPSLKKPVGEPADQNPGSPWAVLVDGGSEETARGRYRRASQRAPRDGWQEVGASHSTDESGEPNLKGPGGGKGAPGHGTGGGKDGEDIEPRIHPNVTASDS